ncbi:MAG TPA: hypothetical protein VF604_01555 [Pyrinomonadaceae bacterium]|jgi:hypothetical protein
MPLVTFSFNSFNTSKPSSFVNQRFTGLPCKLGLGQTFSDQVENPLVDACKAKLLFLSTVKQSRTGAIASCPGTIAREVGHKEWIGHHKYKKKLLLSHSVLKEVAETKLDFELRRIHFAVQEIKSETRSAAFSTVAMRARIKWERWTLPEIKTAIEIGISEIENNKQII